MRREASSSVVKDYTASISEGWQVGLKMGWCDFVHGDWCAIKKWDLFTEQSTIKQIYIWTIYQLNTKWVQMAYV